MILSILAFLFGSIVGSFLNVCIVRLPKEMSLISPPSHCQNCRAAIHFYDNIPIFSYMFLLGRCRSCRVQISIRYFFVEFLMATLSIALLQHLGLGLAYFAYFVLVASMIVIAFIDLDFQLVPDIISLPGIGLGLALSLIVYLVPLDNNILPSPLSSALGILIGGGLLLLVAWMYRLYTSVEGMGKGDVKLLAMIGAFLGWPSIPIVLLFSSLTASVVGLAYIFLKKGGRKFALPFAPFLCLGALLHLFFGNEFIDFYYQLL